MKKQPNRTLKNHQRRVELLQRIDEYLKKSGPLTISEFVMEFDMYRSTLYKLQSRGFLISELIKSNKQNGKERLLIGVDWPVVDAVILPDNLQGKRKILNKIARKTEGNPMTLKELSFAVDRPISTLRGWQYEKLLTSKLVGRRTMVTGVNRETYNDFMVRR